MALEGVGKDAADEVVQVALPQLLAAIGKSVGEFNVRVLELTQLGKDYKATLDRFAAIADRAVAVLEHVEKKLEAEGINLTLGKA